MNVILDDRQATTFLSDVSQGLRQDGHGWTGWNLLALQGIPEPSDLQTIKAILSVAILLEKYDGVVFASQGVVFAIYENSDFIKPHSLKADLEETLSLPLTGLTLHSLSLQQDRSKIIDLLQAHRAEDEKEITKTSADYLEKTLPRFSDWIGFWYQHGRDIHGHAEPRIMLVDDDAMTRHIVHKSMADRHHLLLAQNSAEAMRKHILFKPDLIFLDIDLPDCDGYAFLDYVKRHDKACQVVMFSSNGRLTNRVQAFAAGANGFIVKPFARDTFESYIADWNAHATL